MKRLGLSGTQLAESPTGRTKLLTTGSTVADVLAMVPRVYGGSNYHAAAAAFVRFLGATAETSPLHHLELDQERFVAHLRDRHYKNSTIKAYRHSINCLLDLARLHGWEIPASVMPADWFLVLSFEKTKAMSSIVDHAIRLKKKPSTYSEVDLAAWCQETVQRGRTLGTCRHYCTAFRTLLAKAELAHLMPAIRPRLGDYGVSLANMHPSLRSEVMQLVEYRTAPFNPDREAKPIREATVRRLINFIIALVGYSQNVCALPQVESLSTLFVKKTVTGFVSWSISERKIQEAGLQNGLAAIRQSFRNHHDYQHLELSWLDKLTKQLQPVPREEIDRRKQEKLITFAAAEEIPTKIRVARNKVNPSDAVGLASSLRDELLMLWLTILPWRQRNFRQARITGATHPNIFFAPITTSSSATQAKWIAKQEKEAPGLPVWQVYFTKDETKSKNTVTGFVPSELIAPLVAYLAHRNALIPDGQPDPGTLFVTDNGAAMNSHKIRNVIQDLTSRYAGVAVSPHLFRDIVAYEWLQKNPADYPTISKILWHKSVEFTMRIYGSRFDESTGIARMDDWRSSR